MSFSAGGQYVDGKPSFDLFGLLGKSDIGAQGAEELLEIEDLARDAGYGFDRIRIDPSVVRGLEYYTGPVFEAELTFETKDEKGNPVRFGSVGGGGRYDGLIGRFRAENTPATGFSIGVSRLYAALKLVGSADRRGARAARAGGGAGARPRPPRRLPAHGRARCARVGIASEIYLGAAGMKAQMKYADKRNSPRGHHPGLGRKGQGRGADQGSRRRRARGGLHRHQ